MPVTLEDEEYDQMLTYGMVGLAITECQAIESFLMFCLSVVLKDSDGNSFEDIKNPKTRKKTVGQFLTKLRDKAEIDPSFDDLLGFFDHRNTLVHKLTSEKIYDFHTSQGRKNIRIFLTMFAGLSDTINKTLLGIIFHWVEPEKYQDLSAVPVRFAEGTFLGDIEQIFAPHAASIIRTKD